MTFDELVRRSRLEGDSVYQGTLLALDPGHTTGWCLFQDLKLIACGQIDTSELVPKTSQNLRQLFDYNPTDLVYEDYRVYKWRVQQHANSSLHTTKLIGMIELIAMDKGLESVVQMAAVAKGFATDEKLEEWGFYQPSQRHARDAIRHACFYITYGKKDDWKKRPGRRMTVG